MTLTPLPNQVVRLKCPFGDSADVLGRVVDRLSTQFTAVYMDGTDTLTFRFYKDKGVSWEMQDDE